jgi:Na+-transporting methylmalonyl-CoA/oxaloacetate decarboxylase gamma subunit
MMTLTPADTLASVAAGPGLIDVGVQITWLGISAVFSGLLILALLLPLLRWLVEPKKRALALKKADTEGSPGQAQAFSPEEIAAVTAAIHAHFVHLDRMHESKITWQDHEKPYSPWRLAGRAKILLAKSSLRLRNRRV